MIAFMPDSSLRCPSWQMSSPAPGISLPVSQSVFERSMISPADSGSSQTPIIFLAIAGEHLAAGLSTDCELLLGLVSAGIIHITAFKVATIGVMPVPQP